MPTILNIDILKCVYIINDTSNDLGKPRKRKTPDESDSNLVGPEDPERGNPSATRIKNQQ